MNRRYYAQAGLGLYAGLCMGVVMTARHHLSTVAALVLCTVLALGHAALSGYVWDLAAKLAPERARTPAPIIGLVAGLLMFAFTMVLWMRK